MNKMLRFRLEKGVGRGNGVHIIKARVRAEVGARINKICEDVEGRIGSLINNFTPSAIGCNNPNGPTMLGPLRCCI